MKDRAPTVDSAFLRPPPAKLLISYAQNFEDVLLRRVFSDVDDGFYVDIGAFHPVIGSVTKIFYDRGWNGINIEPGSSFERLVSDRPRDINLNLAIFDEAGTLSFVENTNDPGASHVAISTGAEPVEGASRTYDVPCERLDHVLADHAGGRLINFLKIDAEGSESRIIQSTDWRKIRPQVLVIEAVAPWTNELISQDWEPTLLSSGYQRAYFDGLNLFFVRDEDAALLRHFDRPVNALDWFARYDPIKDGALADVEELRHQNWLVQQKAHADVEEFRRLNWLLEIKLFDLIRGIALQLDRLPRRLRGLPEEVESDELTSPPAPEPEQQLQEIRIALDYTFRYDRAAEHLGEALNRRRGVLATPDRAEGSRPEPRPEPEQLRQELEAAIEAAIRCDRIVGQLVDPGGSRALRMVLPLARLIRRTRSLAADKLVTAKPAGVDTHPAIVKARLRAAWGKLGKFLYRVVRPVFHPIALRTREFMLEPLRPISGRVDEIARDVEMIRRAVANAQGADQLSPELLKSIEALLLTVSVHESRR